MSTLIAARSSLARHLSRDYARQRAAAGDSVYPSPAIYSWNGWLRRQWAELIADPPPDLPVLLSPRQERLLWERVLRDSPEAAGMLDPAAAAALASSAQSLAHAWRIPFTGPAYGLTDDSAAFERWHARISEICRQEGWAPVCLLPELIQPFVDKKARLDLAGFENATPQQREFLGRFACHILARPESTAPETRVTVFRDSVEEWHAAAEWAYKVLETDPAAGVAIISAECTRFQSLAAQAMDRMIPGRWRLASGSPLAAEPLVASALSLLEFLHPSASIAAIGANLLSPYISAASEERFARAAEDARLRKRRGPSVPLRDAVRADTCPRFHSMTAAWLDRQKSLPARQSAAAWAHDFHVLLASYRWIEEVTLTSREYAAHEAWRDALSEFASLDRVIGPITASEAKGILENLIAESSFEDPSIAATPVEIMPPEDAAGRSFTHVWLSGFHDQAWPPASSAHPFIPVSLQRQHGVPQASTRLVLERAEQLTAELLSCGQSIVIAQAEFEEDRKQRPSRLFPKTERGFPVQRAKDDSKPGVDRPSPVALETLLDDTGPPLPSGQVHLGGVRVFQWQSACPFHAFAEFRLHARPLEEPPTGFDPRDRGSLLHCALDYCWKEIENSTKLNSLAGEALNDVILRAVDRALTEKWIAANPLSRQMLSVERDRLFQLLRDWLGRERVRKERFRILETELTREIELGGVGVTVRADRIDQLDDGSLVLIDYKSSRKLKKAWEGARPAEPQLPLYAATASLPIAGVTFAAVQPGRCDFVGHSDRKGLLDGGRAKPDPAPIDAWRDTLVALAAAYLQGKAHVDPSKEACGICDLQRLCRIDEAMEDDSDE